MDKSDYYKALSISYTHLALSHSFNAKSCSILGDSSESKFYERIAFEAERLSDRYLEKSNHTD